MDRLIVREREIAAVEMTNTVSVSNPLHAGSDQKGTDEANTAPDVTAFGKTQIKGAGDQLLKAKDANAVVARTEH